MYRINDKTSAIEEVQKFLRLVGNKDIFVAPTGVYDDNTKKSVIDFQSENGINVNGIVDLLTFTKLFDKYLFALKNGITVENTKTFINFPLLPGQFNDAMIHINRTLSRLLDYYGHTHNLMESNFYSKSTIEAVSIIRKIYLLQDKNLIDEELYRRMIDDHNSIFESDEVFY